MQYSKFAECLTGECQIFICMTLLDARTWMWILYRLIYLFRAHTPTLLWASSSISTWRAAHISITGSLCTFEGKQFWGDSQSKRFPVSFFTPRRRNHTSQHILKEIKKLLTNPCVRFRSLSMWSLAWYCCECIIICSFVWMHFRLAQRGGEDARGRRHSSSSSRRVRSLFGRLYFWLIKSAVLLQSQTPAMTPLRNQPQCQKYLR